MENVKVDVVASLSLLALELRKVEPEVADKAIQPIVVEVDALRVEMEAGLRALCSAEHFSDDARLEAVIGVFADFILRHHALDEPRKYAELLTEPQTRSLRGYAKAAHVLYLFARHVETAELLKLYGKGSIATFGPLSDKDFLTNHRRMRNAGLMVEAFVHLLVRNELYKKYAKQYRHNLLIARIRESSRKDVCAAYLQRLQEFKDHGIALSLSRRSALYWELVASYERAGIAASTQHLASSRAQEPSDTTLLFTKSGSIVKPSPA